MKTLKKTLCLVLAVVMVVGVLVLPASAAVDTTNVNKDYKAAFDALVNYGVLKGRTGTDTAAATENVRRDEVAAIVYRVMTGDTGEKIVSDYVSKAAMFKDNFLWGKGQIGYCADAGLIKGRGNGYYDAADPVTGNELLAVMLRAVGYGKNGEFEGANWAQAVQFKATELGILGNVKIDLSKALTREEVAYIVFNAATKAPRVTYKNGAYQYETEPYVLDSKNNVALIVEKAAVKQDADDWGAPTGSKTEVVFTHPATNVTNSYTTPVANKTFWVSTTECDIATAMGFTKDTTAVGYLNGAKNKVTSIVGIDPLNTVSTIGAQGRETVVYADGTVVMKDRYFAVVDSLVAAVKDSAGHEVSPATANITIYSDAGKASATLENTDGDYTKGQMMMVNVLLNDDTIDTTETYDDDTVTYIADVTSVDVTVSAIQRNASGKVVGIVAGNTEYLYNCTYGYNKVDQSYWMSTTASNDEYAMLNNSAIGETVKLYLDAQGNILGVAPASTVKETAAVVIGAQEVRIGVNKYAVEVEIYNEKGETQTIRVVDDDGDPFKLERDAATKATDIANYLLIKYSATKTEGYYKVTGPTGTVTSFLTGYIRAGDAEALGASNPIVNDKTVYFLARYGLKNSANGSRTAYKFNGYQVVNGFKSIDDLSYEAGSEIEDVTSPALTAYYIAKDGKASYVLIINANNVDGDTKVPVANYAYLTKTDKLSATYDDVYQFDAFINGSATKLSVYSGGSTVNLPGLYTYGSTVTNGGYSGVQPSYVDANSNNRYDAGEETKLAAGTYGYADGVLTVYNDDTATHTAVDHIAVANDAVLYLINEFNGTCTKQEDLTLLSVAKYTGKCAIWYQFDELGWIDGIYMVEDDMGSAHTPAGTGVPAAGKAKITGVNDWTEQTTPAADTVKYLPAGAYVFAGQVATDAPNAADTIYFAYQSTSKGALLQIKNSAGTVVYSEASTAEAGGHYFYIDVSATSTSPANGLAAGTYSWSVTYGATTYASGTFTIAIKA